jgi:hypothetical protein
LVTKRLYIAGFTYLILVAIPDRGQAADPAFCRRYARDTLVQVRKGLTSPHCGVGLARHPLVK